MRYIWRPGGRPRMHVQAQDAAGAPYNGALCGMGFHDDYRTINAPFALGRPVCRHCNAVIERRRKRPNWLN